MNYIKTDFVDNTKYTNSKNKALTQNKYASYRKDYDIEWLLAANWYNKWPSNFLREFTDWSHIRLITSNIEAKRTYDAQIALMLWKWFSWDEIMQQLITGKIIAKKEIKKDVTTDKNIPVITEKKVQKKQIIETKEWLQTPWTFIELPKNSQGMRVRKYIVKSWWTAWRIKELFYSNVKDTNISIVNADATIKYLPNQKFWAWDEVYVVEERNSINLSNKWSQSNQIEKNEFSSREEEIVDRVEKNIIKLHNIFRWNKNAITYPDWYHDVLKLSKSKYKYTLKRIIWDMWATVEMEVFDKNDTSLHTIVYSEFSWWWSATVIIDGYKLRIEDNKLEKWDIAKFDTYQEIFDKVYTLLLQGK